MPLGFYKAIAGVGRRRAPGLQFVAALGGTVTDVVIDGLNFRLHTFPTAGDNDFVVSSPGLIDVLLVGGSGGSGKSGNSGTSTHGQNGGRVTNATEISVTSQTYSITVGAGGAVRTTTGFGFVGGTSSAFGFSAIGGNGNGTVNGSHTNGGSGNGGLNPGTQSIAHFAGNNTGGSGGDGGTSTIRGTLEHFGGGGRGVSNAIQGTNGLGQNNFGGGKVGYFNAVDPGQSGKTGAVIVRYRLP